MYLAGPLVVANKVVVFCCHICPFCAKVKALLDSLTTEVSYFYVDKMENGEAIHGDVIKFTGFETLPVVFIDGQLIGGYSDTDLLHQEGKLVPMLE